MNEKIVEVKLRDGVKALGGVAYKWVSPGNAGVPDRVVALPGGAVHFIELKREGGMLTRMQKAQIARLRALGTDCAVVYGLAGVESYLKIAREVVRHGISAACLPEILH